MQSHTDSSNIKTQNQLVSPINNKVINEDVDKYNLKIRLLQLEYLNKRLDLSLPEKESRMEEKVKNIMQEVFNEYTALLECHKKEDEVRKNNHTKKSLIKKLDLLKLLNKDFEDLFLSKNLDFFITHLFDLTKEEINTLKNVENAIDRTKPFLNVENSNELLVDEFFDKKNKLLELNTNNKNLLQELNMLKMKINENNNLEKCLKLDEEINKILSNQ